MKKKLTALVLSGLVLASFNLQGYAANNKNVKVTTKATNKAAKNNVKSTKPTTKTTTKPTTKTTTKPTTKTTTKPTTKTNTKVTNKTKTTTIKYAPNTLVRLYSKDISINEFKTLMTIAAVNYQLNKQTAIWNEVDSTTKKKVTDILQQNILNTVIDNNIQKYNAAKDGIKLTSEEQVSVDSEVYNNLNALDTNTTINTSYKDALKKLQLSDKDFRNYFKQLVKDNYILGDFKEKLYNAYKVTIPETVIEQTYVAQNEKVGARHIMIGIGQYSKDGTRTDADAKKLALDVLDKLNKGAKFEDLVTQYSDDPGSLSTGGYYEFGKGEMVQEFETTAFSQKDGQVSQPVKTSYGYHIIQTQKHIPANAKNMTDTDKSTITESLRSSKFKDYYDNKVKEWAKEAKVTIVKGKIEISK